LGEKVKKTSHVKNEVQAPRNEIEIVEQWLKERERYEMRDSVETPIFKHSDNPIDDLREFLKKAWVTKK
jgi:hypothetical protein